MSKPSSVMLTGAHSNTQDTGEDLRTASQVRTISLPEGSNPDSKKGLLHPPSPHFGHYPTHSTFSDPVHSVDTAVYRSRRTGVDPIPSSSISTNAPSGGSQSQRRHSSYATYTTPHPHPSGDIACYPSPPYENSSLPITHTSSGDRVVEVEQSTVSTSRAGSGVIKLFSIGDCRPLEPGEIFPSLKDGTDRDTEIDPGSSSESKGENDTVRLVWVDSFNDADALLLLPPRPQPQPTLLNTTTTNPNETTALLLVGPAMKHALQWREKHGCVRTGIAKPRMHPYKFVRGKRGEEVSSKSHDGVRRCSLP